MLSVCCVTALVWLFREKVLPSPLVTERQVVIILRLVT